MLGDRQDLGRVSASGPLRRAFPLSGAAVGPGRDGQGTQERPPAMRASERDVKCQLLPTCLSPTLRNRGRPKKARKDRSNCGCPVFLALELCRLPGQ